jgi:hypothetical protein
MAGVLPYLATSLSTVYCAWEINHAAATGAGVFMSGRSAELLLHVLEPLQIGYGAVVSLALPRTLQLLTSSRSSHSWVLSIGVWSMPAMEVIMGIVDML